MSDSLGLVGFLRILFEEINIMCLFNFQITCKFHDLQKKILPEDLNCLDMPRNWLTDMHMKMHLKE